MNVINLKVDFEKRTIKQTGVNLTTGDYNSTKLVFEFDKEYEEIKVCEIAKKEDSDGNNEAVFVEEIIDNEVVLGALADITNDDGYIKYKDGSDNIYWYDEENEQLYDNEGNTSSVELSTLTKVQQSVSIFDEAGKYVLEVSLYGENSKLTSAFIDLTVRPGMVRVGNERVTQYIPIFDTLMNQATTIINELETIETTISAAETTRQSNETTRQNNETTRQSNESTRQSNESTRTSNETSRVSAETARATAETSRQSAESSRETAETARATAEISRGTAETARQSNETSRASAESARATAETARATAETNRASAESTRASNESSRQNAENTRDSNETTRQSNETTRQTNESSRASAETARAEAETARGTAETTRASNETTRQSNETTRQTNEATRQSNEETRQANELARESVIESLRHDLNVATLDSTDTPSDAITLQDTVQAQLKKFVLKGKTEQFSTTGKQLIPFTNQDFTINGVRYHVIDGKMYLNGTSQGETPTTTFRDLFYFTLEAGDYIFSRNTTVPFRIAKRSNDEEIMLISGSVTSKTFTITETTEVYLGFYIYQRTFDNQEVLLQLEKGTTVTDWEKYTRSEYQVLIQIFHRR